MATKLNKNLTRETAVMKDGKSVYVTLTEFQEIEMRLRHERQSAKISIADLYDQLNGAPPVTPAKKSANATFDDFIYHLKINAHTMDITQAELMILHEVLTRTLEDVGLAPTMLHK